MCEATACIIQCLVTDAHQIEHNILQLLTLLL